MAGNRTKEAELRVRIETVVNLVLSGLRYTEMWRVVSENTGWGISERTFARYLHTAYDTVAEMAEANEEREMALARGRLVDLYKKCMSTQDYRTCLAILRETIILNNLYPAEKHEHTGPAGGPIQYEDMTSDERRRRIEELLAKREGRDSVLKTS